MSQGQVSVGHPVDVASGLVYTGCRDVLIPGTIALDWERAYSTGSLDQAGSVLGLGWTNRYLATLSRGESGYALTMPEGGVETFADPDGTVERGGILRHLGSFQELSRDRRGYVVTRWDSTTGRVHRLVFASGPVGRTWPMISIEDVTGHALDMLRDGSGRLVGVRQRLERRTLLLKYSADGRIEEIRFQGPDGRNEILARYEYDATGRLTTAYDAAGHADRYEYDPAGRMTREILKDGSDFYFLYDSSGRCVKTSGQSRYDEKSFRYFDAIRWTEVTNSKGAVTRYEWLPTGQVTRIVDAVGGETRIEYDEHGRVVAEVDPNGAATRFEYDSAGNRSRIKKPLGYVATYEFDTNHQGVALSDPLGQVWRRRYDAQNRLVESVDPLGGRWLYAYDAAGNLVGVTNPRGYQRRRFFSEHGVLLAQTDWEGHRTSYTVDAFGRRIERRDALGEVTRVEYDHRGRPIRVLFPDGAQVTSEYDPGGNLIRRTTATGGTYAYRYGQCGRLLERRDPLGNVVKYRWGTEPGALETIINEKGERYTIDRDLLGRIIRETGFDGRVMEFAYDKASRCVATINGMGKKSTFVIDDLGRLREKRLPDGEIVAFEYDLCSNPLSATNSTCRIAFERDALGRVVKEEQGDYSIERDWDADDNPTRVRTSLGFELVYVTDGNGNLLSLTTDDQLRLRLERNAAGREVRRALPGGFELWQQYGPLSQLLTQRVRPEQAPWTESRPSLAGEHGASQGHATVARDYQYDLDGRLIWYADQRWGPQQYEYDPADHLLKAMRGDGGSETFDYDPAGNITRALRTLGSGGPPRSESLQYGPGNRLSQQDGLTYDYDGNGRRTSKVATHGSRRQEWRYEWDAQDQLVRVTSPDGVAWAYAYDAFGRRISKEGPEGLTRFVWDQDAVIHEIADGSVKSTWVYDLHSFEPIYSIQAGAGYAVICDHLGTPRELLDDRGEVAWAMSHMAWGLVTAVTAERVECPLRFRGQWFDKETGLSYNRFRYYDPLNGHFLSADPVGLQGGLNLYCYARNPVTWVDPYALTEDDACLAKKAKEDAERDMREDDRSLSAHDKEFYGGDGVIYMVPGSGTPSGKPYIGSADDLGVRAATATDNRDRSQAVVVGSYPIGDRDARRAAEQRAIDDMGGIKNLDNKRNEIKK